MKTKDKNTAFVNPFKILIIWLQNQEPSTTSLIFAKTRIIELNHTHKRAGKGIREPNRGKPCVL